MDIFTDASLNDCQKIAGVAAIFVPCPNSNQIVTHSTYCTVGNIETAELFAIATALGVLTRINSGSIRVVSDSLAALRKIQHIFRYPNPEKIHAVTDLMQEKILYNISNSFERMKNVDFSFCHVHGHQRKAPMFSDGYYNMIADQEATVGRIKGENALLRAERMILMSDSSSEEEKILLTQLECSITSPKQISFHLNNGEPDKSKVIVPAHKRKKESYYHRAKQRSKRTR